MPTGIVIAGASTLVPKSRFTFSARKPPYLNTTRRPRLKTSDEIKNARAFHGVPSARSIKMPWIQSIPADANRSVTHSGSPHA
jgi:hypothetical protein